jgi:large subunit ribosomal protein L22
MKAILHNYRQAPRKVRLVTQLIKGKKVQDAVIELDFLAKRASLPIKKLLNSAVANALSKADVKKEDLYVSNVMVDKGVVLKRSMPRARGSAFPIHKHTSNVVIELGVKDSSKVKGAKPKTTKKTNK